MRIKKIAPETPANGNIENTHGTSQTDTYSQEYINGAINDQSNNIVRIKDDTTNFVIAPNHVNNIMDFYYDKATGLCIFTFRISTKDNDPQYNTYNAWQNQVTIPSKYTPRAINFTPVYAGNQGSVARIQPRTDSANKGKIDVYAYASYTLVEGTLIWYIEAGIN